MTEAELIARAKRGDADAYEELVRTYQGIAFRTAWLVAGNAADAEEAAQDGFVKAYRALWRFRSGAPFKPWLLRIVTSGTNDAVAFKNPDGSIVVQVYNKGTAAKTTIVGVGSALSQTLYQFSVPAHGWATLRLPP